MLIDENWSISIDRIRTFFAQQPDVSVTAEGFCYRDCRVTLSEVSGEVMNRWPIPRTRVQMEGSKEDVKAIYQRFYLRFLSAGG